MNVDYGVRENVSSAQDNRVVWDITSTHFLLMFMLSELHNGCACTSVQPLQGD